ncbi:MAG TPA: outer membrane lipoprotein chaperone LolA [Blastocatellia bacterium]|nr:outer membrane lipoprotein chaperone LolA [Blastocatellia bacterium]
MARCIDVSLSLFWKGPAAVLRNCRVPFPVYALVLSTTVSVLTSLTADVKSNCLPPVQSSDLNNLIDGLQRKYSRMQGLGADFVQVYRGSDGRIIREAGQLLLRRPGKARWEYTSPEHKLFLSDGKNVFFYVYGEKTATVSPIKETVDPQIPFLFLLGRGNLRRDFLRIEIAAGEASTDSDHQVLRLFPKKAPEEFKQLLVEVNSPSFEVRRMVIFERSGARMDFFLSNVRENFVASEEQFRFSAPPGVIVKRAQ